MAKAEATHKVTFVMGEGLWVAAKQRALDERVTLTALLLEGLELRLGQKINLRGIARRDFRRRSGAEKGGKS